MVGLMIFFSIFACKSEFIKGTGDIIKEVPVPRDSLMKIKKEPQETMFCLKASFEISGNGVKTAAAGTVESSAGSAVKIAYVG